MHRIDRHSKISVQSHAALADFDVNFVLPLVGRIIWRTCVDVIVTVQDFHCITRGRCCVLRRRFRLATCMQNNVKNPPVVSVRAQCLCHSKGGVHLDLEKLFRFSHGVKWFQWDISYMSPNVCRPNNMANMGAHGEALARGHERQTGGFLCASFCLQRFAGTRNL